MQQLSSQNVRSYKTVEGLEKSMIKFGFDAFNFIVVKTIEGLYTPLFYILHTHVVHNEKLNKNIGYHCVGSKGFYVIVI